MVAGEARDTRGAARTGMRGAGLDALAAAEVAFGSAAFGGEAFGKVGFGGVIVRRVAEAGRESDGDRGSRDECKRMGADTRAGGWIVKPPVELRRSVSVGVRGTAAPESLRPRDSTALGCGDNAAFGVTAVGDGRGRARCVVDAGRFDAERV